jgi:hypothetical protein
MATIFGEDGYAVGAILPRLQRRGLSRAWSTDRATSTIVATLYPMSRLRYSIVESPHLGTSPRVALSALLHALEHQMVHL